jgi:TRAP-type C4-dicarboxylate transport system permease small subunit
MKAIRVISQLFIWLCMVFIFALMLLMVAEVVFREVFNSSIVGGTEWAQVLLLMDMTALGAAIISNRQIKVDALTTKFSAKAQVITDIVVLTLSFVAITVTAWQQFDYCLQSFNKHISYQNIKLPQWPFVAVFSLAYAVGALATLALIVRKVMCMFRGEWNREAKREDMDEIFVLGRKKYAEIQAAAELNRDRGGEDFVKESKQ